MFFFQFMLLLSSFWSSKKKTSKMFIHYFLIGNKNIFQKKKFLTADIINRSSLWLFQSGGNRMIKKKKTKTKIFNSLAQKKCLNPVFFEDDFHFHFIFHFSWILIIFKVFHWRSCLLSKKKTNYLFMQVFYTSFGFSFCVNNVVVVVAMNWFQIKSINKICFLFLVKKKKCFSKFSAFDHQW